jgi:hypothetical protein
VQKINKNEKKKIPFFMDEKEESNLSFWGARKH